MGSKKSNRSRSRSSHSQLRSHHSKTPSIRSKSPSIHSQPASIHSQPASIHSQPRSNDSDQRSDHCSRYSNHSDSRSRSRSNKSVTRSQSRSHRTRSRSNQSHSKSRSKSYDSKRDYSEPQRNHSQRHSRSQSSSYRSQSGSEKSQTSRKKMSSINRNYSQTCTSSIQKMNRDNTLRTRDCMLGWSRSSSYVRGRQNFNENSKAKRLDTYHQREMHRAKNQVRNNFPASPQSRNRLRVEESYRVYQQRLTNRTKVQTVSSPDLSSRRSDSQHHRNREYNSPGLSETHSNNDSTLLQTLVKEVKDIKKCVTKNDRRFVESDRRLTRLETTANKIFIVLGDLSNAMNARMLLGNALPREDKPPKGFHTPKMPIKRFKELVMVNKDLKNKDFFNYLVNCEKEFCCYSSSTDTATMTSYLRRFIDVDLKASIVLKDLKGQEGMTLYHDFHNIYLFLIETMKEGYRIKNKILSNKDVHLVLRTVWGRSKQAAEEANKRR